MAMKSRIGLITDTPSILESLKKDFPDSHVYTAKNAMDLYALVGSNKIELICIAGGDKVVADFAASYAYLRQKQQFKNLPIAVFSQIPIVAKFPVVDPLVRSFPLDGGFFVPVVSLESLDKTLTTSKSFFEQEQVEAEFCKALFHKISQNQEFHAIPATDDEAHAEFIVQSSGEISCNIFWVKYSARILKENSEELRHTVESLSEAEQQTVMEQMIEAVIHELNDSLTTLLKEQGALFFNHSGLLPAADKAPFIKRAKSLTVVFEAPACHFLVEFIYYI